MEHLQASNLLPRFVAGELDPERERELRRHLERCDECRGWVEISELLSGLAAEAPAGERHPAAEELTTLALDPRSLADGARGRLVSHLERCPSCREEVGLARAAIEAARPAPAPAIGRAAGLGWRAAAGLLMAAGLAMAAGLWLGRPAGAPEEAAIIGRVLTGEETLSAGRSMVVSATQVSPGASVVLEGGQSVALGDGFSVGEGATLTVSNPSPIRPSSTPDQPISTLDRKEQDT